MNCIKPPPITDDQLSAILDGVVDADTQAHLANCPACALRLDNARQLEQRLTRILHQWDCPTPEQLGDYALELLPASEAGKIMMHLAQCATCAQEVADLVALLADQVVQTPPAPARSTHGIGRRLTELVAQLITPAPQLALRGESQGPSIAMAGDITILYDTQSAPDGMWEIVGQLIDSAAQSRWNGALVEVRTPDTLAATAIVDESGGFACGLPQVNSLSLRITAENGTTLLVPDIRHET